MDFALPVFYLGQLLKQYSLCFGKTDKNGFDGWAINSNCFVIIMAKSTTFSFFAH